MKLHLSLTGTSTALQHNGRLANPLDPYTKQLKPLVGKRKKTEDDYMLVAAIEFRGSLYETSEGLIGWPTANVWRVLYDSAKVSRLGELVKEALLFDDIVEPIVFPDGETRTADDYLVKHPEMMYYVSAKVQQQRPMRARPMIPTGWRSDHTLELFDDLLEATLLGPVFERSGRKGIGDWRAKFGKFSVQVEAE